MTSGTEPHQAVDDRDDPHPADQQHPRSAFPGAGERVGDAEREAALRAEPAGNATVGDMVDTDAIDSRAHETGPGALEVAEQVHGAAKVPES